MDGRMARRRVGVPVLGRDRQLVHIVQHPCGARRLCDQMQCWSFSFNSTKDTVEIKCCTSLSMI